MFLEPFSTYSGTCISLHVFVQVYLNEVKTIKGLLETPKDNHITKNVGWYTGSGVAWWTVMMIIVVNLPEHEEMFKEDLNIASSICDHCDTTPSNT